MWVSLVLVLLVGATATDIPTQTEYQTAWEPGLEYKYVVRSYTTTSLGEHNNPINDQISGVVINALLTIQVKSPDTLIGNLAKAQYAQVHKELPQDLEFLPDSKLNYKSLPLKGKNFLIILKRGIIRKLKVDSETPVWELNILKSIASQLQLDTLGKNAIRRSDTQLPSDKSPFGLYNVLEQSVGGDCEVQYNIMPLSKADELDPNLIPISRLTQGVTSFDIRKTKNYQNCRDPKVLSVNIDSNTKIVTRMSTSRSIISGSLKKYTIQVFLAKSSIVISLDENSALGTINTISRMTLRAKREIRQPLQESESLIPVNDLTYSYEYSLDQLEDRSRKSVSSSKESLENTKDILLDNTRSFEEFYRNPHHRSVFNKQLSTSLDDLPKSPLIYDVGYTTLQLTTEQRINKIRALIEVVIKDLGTNKNLSHAPSEYLLVVKLMRTLKLKSLNELKLLLEQDDNSLLAEDVRYPLKDVKYLKLTAVKIFYKALAELGTGPALLLIKQLIKENKLQGLEAARAIKRLDTAARFLTVEYIEAVCDMMVDPIVTKEKALNQTVSLVCGKLLRKADKSFTKFINNKDLQNLISRYIDIMDQKLMQALKDNDVAQAYAIVLGLGYTADPKIISVFEPYLEGTYVEGTKMLVKRIYDYELAENEDVQVQRVNRTEFDKKRWGDYLGDAGTEAIEVNVPKQLRKMMIMMLDDVIRRNPSSTRSIVHKIFLNQQESLELRCIAVNSYIMSNPSTLGLMQVVNHANIESNKELRSCVRNSLINAAKDQPLLRANLETKARIVLKYLEPSSIRDIWDIAIDWIISVTEKIVSDIIGDSYNKVPLSMPFRVQPYRLPTAIENIWDAVTDWFSSIVGKLISRITGDNYDNVPSSVYVHMEPHRSQFDVKNTIFAYDVSDMGQLVENILSWRIDEKTQKLEKKQMMTPHITQIMHELNLKPVDMGLEGFVFMENAPESFVYSLDTSTIDTVMKKLAQIFLFNNPLNYVSMDVNDELLSLPIETGLPFVFAIEKPMITLIDVAGKMQELLHVRGNINVLDSSKVQYKVSFATPFEQWEYISGVDKARVVVAPLAFDLKLLDKDNEKTLSAKLSPSWQINNADKLLLLTNTPYTAINNLREDESYRSANIHPIQLANRLKKAIDIRFLRLTTELDTACLEKITLRDYLAIGTIGSIAPVVCNYNIALQTKKDWTPKEEVLVTSVYMKDEVNSQTDSSSEEEDENEMELEKLLIVDKKPDSRQRRFQFLKQAKKGLTTVISRVVDINVRTFAYEEVPVVDYVLTAALGYNQKNTKLRGYVYYNRQTANENILFEGTISGVMNLQPVTLENLKKAVQSMPEDRYLANVEWKRQGEEEKALKLRLTVRQSDNLRKAIQNSKTVHECLNALENKGEEIYKSCKKAVQLVDTRDDLKWRVEYNEELIRQINQYKIFRNILATPLPLFRYEIRNDPKRVPQNKTVLEMEIKAPFNGRQMDLTLYTPEANIAYSMPKELTQTLPFLQLEQQPSCLITKNNIANFDDVMYDVNIGECWHLMMATTQVSDTTIPLVMVEEDGNGDLAVAVITRTKGHFYLRANEGKLLASLSTTQLLSSSRDSTYYGHGLWIYSTPRNLRLVTQDYKLEVIFYGKAVIIRVSDELRNKLTGLCSDYDAENIMGPKGCQMNTPEEFVASYAVPSMDCKGPALVNKQKANMAIAMCTCPRQLSRNVISDEEAGRGPINQNRTRVHHNALNTYDQKLNVNHRIWYYFENPSTICFTTVRVPQCLIFASWPEDLEQKQYDVYCTAIDDAAMAIKENIDEGVNVDLSDRPVTKTKILNIPRRCSDPKPPAPVNSPFE